MRAIVVVACVCACGAYDPLDEIPHREFPDTRTAVRAILDEAGETQVYAVGEYHPVEPLGTRASPLAWFTDEILPLLTPPASHLVVEAWFDPRCAADRDPVQAQIQAATRRPPSQHADLSRLVATSAPDRLSTYGLPMTCIEHSSVLDARGRVDFYLLLAMVTEKLDGVTRAVARTGERVIVYGGALHNDLYPRWPLEQLAYGHVLARDFRVLELDLVVPEVVAASGSGKRTSALAHEDWFPLLAKASPERVVVWERGPRSYVVILPGRGVPAVARR